MENEEIVNRALKPTPTLMGLPEEVGVHTPNHPNSDYTIKMTMSYNNKTYML